MQPKTSLRLFSATFFAALGLTPLVACSSSTSSGSGRQPATNTGGDGPTEAGATGGSSQGTGGAAAGGSSSSTGGVASGGTSGSGGSHTSRDGGGDSGDAGRSVCENPTPRIGTDGQPTGFVDCANGFSHRVEKRTCSSTLPRSTICGDGTPVGDAGLASGLCSKDSDCKDAPNGYCQLSAGLATGCYCSYGCTTDADCGAGYVCGCADPVGVCVPTANCTVDADCGPGLLCITSSDFGGCGVTFACQVASDTCASPADCPVDAPKCVYNTDHHECSIGHPCGTGRPFLVGGEIRVATLSGGAGWTSDLVPDLRGLDAAARERAARHWTEVALMEHASIAAFARFALDLMSLGAPSSLVLAAQSAMADETAHAEDAFALASAYAGRALSPGALDSGCELERRTPIDIVRTTIIEGCIGETVAAVEAAEALAHATDPAVRAALSRVTRDETRHAELAWRFLRWVLDHGAAELRDATARELEHVMGAELARKDSSSAAPEARSAGAAAHGVLDAGTRCKLRRRVVADVIVPCADAVVSALRAPKPGSRASAAVAAACTYSSTQLS